MPESTLREKRLRLNLPDDWKPLPNPDGPASFYKDERQAIFQVAVMGRESRHEVASTDIATLIRLAADHGRSGQLGEPIDVGPGSCGIGPCGRASFAYADDGVFHLWYITDGHDLILASYISPTHMTDGEIVDLVAILQNLRYL